MTRLLVFVTVTLTALAACGDPPNIPEVESPDHGIIRGEHEVALARMPSEIIELLPSEWSHRTSSSGQQRDEPRNGRETQCHPLGFRACHPHGQPEQGRERDQVRRDHRHPSGVSRQLSGATPAAAPLGWRYFQIRSPTCRCGNAAVYSKRPRNRSGRSPACLRSVRRAPGNPRG